MELIIKIKELEKQVSKLPIEGTLYSFFGNIEIERITELEKELAQQRPQREGEERNP
nr:hypothetical protein [uncultured Capnocytophaga sp.]